MTRHNESPPPAAAAMLTDDGDRIEVTWPGGRPRLAEVEPDVVEGWAAAINDAREENRRLTVLLERALSVIDDSAASLTAIGQWADRPAADHARSIRSEHQALRTRIPTGKRALIRP